MVPAMPATATQNSGLGTRVSAAVRGFFDDSSVAWTFGVILPPVMLIADPVVFRGNMIAGSALLGGYRTSCYLGIALAMIAMVVVLKSARGNAFFAGMMAAASLFGTAIGLVILPFSLIGILFFGIGLLGLSPFLSATVFALWSRRALRGSDPRRRRLKATAGVVVFFGLCLGTQMATSHLLRSSIDDIASSRLRKSRAATDRLARWHLLVDMEAFIPAWESNPDPEAKQRLADAYKVITGEDLAAHAARLRD